MVSSSVTTHVAMSLGERDGGFGGVDAKEGVQGGRGSRNVVSSQCRCAKSVGDLDWRCKGEVRIVVV